MRILVDADALPSAAKEILFRAAERCKVSLCLVANKPLRTPPSEFLSSVVVEAGSDVADHWIVAQVEAQDLVITADIPLADRVVSKGAVALDPRGTLYTGDNVKERLAMRNLMDGLRGADMIQGGGPPPFNGKAAQKFANQLNSYLAKF